MKLRVLDVIAYASGGRLEAELDRAQRRVVAEVEDARDGAEITIKLKYRPVAENGVGVTVTCATKMPKRESIEECFAMHEGVLSADAEDLIDALSGLSEMDRALQLAEQMLNDREQRKMEAEYRPSQMREAFKDAYPTAAGGTVPKMSLLNESTGEVTAIPPEAMPRSTANAKKNTKKKPTADA